MTQLPLVCVELYTVTSGVIREDTMCRIREHLLKLPVWLFRWYTAQLPGEQNVCSWSWGHSRSVFQSLERRQWNILTHRKSYK